jgi:hypothetical protein
LELSAQVAPPAQMHAESLTVHKQLQAWNEHKITQRQSRSQG